MPMRKQERRVGWKGVFEFSVLFDDNYFHDHEASYSLKGRGSCDVSGFSEVSFCPVFADPVAGCCVKRQCT